MTMIKDFFQSERTKTQLQEEGFHYTISFVSTGGHKAVKYLDLLNVDL